jgi:hypothetical protein
MDLPDQTTRIRILSDSRGLQYRCGRVSLRGACACCRYVAIGLLLGGIPMSFMYGIVGQYLEGRSRTEVLVSSLGAAMMLGAPLARYLAQLLSEHGVSPDLAPTWLGLAFLPVTLLAMLVLDTVPPPTATDAAKRSERNPADLSEAWKFVGSHKLGCFMITVTCVAPLSDFVLLLLLPRKCPLVPYIVYLGSQRGHGAYPSGACRLQVYGNLCLPKLP